MKILVKLLLLALVAALAAPFFIKGPNGQPLINFKDLIAGNAAISGFTPKTETKLYRWKNEKGELQFGDNPPNGSQAEQMQVTTHINSMKTIELPDGFNEQTEEQSSATSRFNPLDGGASPLSTAPLEKVPEMLEQIEDYQQKLDDRSEMLDDL
jgi:hypothetical protein